MRTLALHKVKKVSITFVGSGDEGHHEDTEIDYRKGAEAVDFDATPLVGFATRLSDAIDALVERAMAKANTDGFQDGEGGQVLIELKPDHTPLGRLVVTQSYYEAVLHRGKGVAL